MGREIDLLVNYPRAKRNVRERGESKTEEDRAIARKFGKDFFDGDRRHGYGGFSYNARFWEPVVPTIQEHYGLSSASSLLDVGCAKGFMLHDFARLIPGITVKGVDVSEYAIAHAIEDARPHVKVADARELPFQDNSFDGLVVCETLHHIAGYDDLTPYLLEFKRVLVKQGWLIVVEPNSYYPVQWLLGPINRIMQRVRPRWRGLVPHERPLSPHFLVRQFKHAGFADSAYFSTTFMHNRFPLSLSQLISSWEDNLRFRYPLKLFGWCVCVYGQKPKS